jgi:hypothetical protein
VAVGATVVGAEGDNVDPVGAIVVGAEGDTVGPGVGVPVGFAEGAGVVGAEGAGVGLAVGAGVGVVVGRAVGAPVRAEGPDVGAVVGSKVGGCVGDGVGATDEAVGASVVGMLVGFMVGACVGAAVGASVGDCVHAPQLHRFAPRTYTLALHAAPRNALEWIVVTEFGMLIVRRLEQDLKVSSGIPVTLLDITTDCRFEQLSKAPVTIVNTESGIRTDVNPDCEKARAPIKATESGIVIVLNAPHWK